MNPHEKFAASRPHKGHAITYRGQPAGTVERVEEALCWVSNGETTLPFIWCFKDGLNNLHSWPTKESGKDCPNGAR